MVTIWDVIGASEVGGFDSERALRDPAHWSDRSSFPDLPDFSTNIQR